MSDFQILDELQMNAYAGQFADVLIKNIDNTFIIFLEGNLGAGKTTFTRSILRHLGYEYAVKSPTFTLVETYELEKIDRTKQKFYHFDLYRLSDPEELDYIGFSDYLEEKAIILIEWAKKGDGFLPSADLVIDIAYYDKKRKLSLSSNTELGKKLIEKFNLCLTYV